MLSVANLKKNNNENDAMRHSKAKPSIAFRKVSETKVMKVSILTKKWLSPSLLAVIFPSLFSCDKNKCFFLKAPGTGPIRIDKIRSSTDFIDKEFSFEYLECPIYIRRKRNEYFEKMLSRVIKRLNVWQSRMLSHKGKYIPIKHFLQSLSLYTLTALTPPKGIIKQMEKHFPSFFWRSTLNKNNYHLST